ncbi:MAG: Asp-tRNA(Asn)/Glu-tRNA(Gln) amidotransferase subunit GatA [Candidatus Omnitrophota bacterium]|nr:Asp-tRNA(Asn)/Glu-tRNA(Gln) amidotransferase subunit GatA [Candidatus Omnitrophota bacterium]
MELCTLTAHELLEKINKKEISFADILRSLQDRIKQVDPKVKAYVRVDGRNENNENGSCRDRFETCPYKGEQTSQSGFLKGLPISLKDNICTEGLNTECCSRILAGFKPPYDATVVKKLKEAGGAIFGLKTNMDEFAFGSSCENSAFGPTCNPWDIERVPGGSSGGSAAAVAADEAIWALGSDTGGSIRQPASFCGVVGLKPTYGRVSRFGLIAFASSLDQIGPFTKDVADSALLMKAIAGHDPSDSTSLDAPVPDYTASLTGDIKGLKIGVPKEYFSQGLDAEVKAIIDAAADKLRNLGAILTEVSLPHTEYAVPVYYIVATAEASSNLARFDGVQYGFRGLEGRNLIDMYMRTRGEAFGQEAKRRILLGTFVLSHGYYDAYYLRAQKVRTLIKKDFDDVFKQVDCLITPVSPTPAFKLGERVEDPLKMYLSDICTISANLAGVPAISLPCGFTKDGLPVGLQIMARPFAEETIFRAAHAYEQSTDWHKRRAKL